MELGSSISTLRAASRAALVGSKTTSNKRPLAFAPLLFAMIVQIMSAPGAHAEVGLIPVSEISVGMKGHGLTVYVGDTPERFEVTALGVLESSLPGQDILLIRLEGERHQHQGVVAGMSGSPIYFDGRLAGALAYGWALSKDPIAGVTPIHGMIAELTGSTPPASRGMSGPRGFERLAMGLVAAGIPDALLEKRLPSLQRLGLPAQVIPGGRAGRAAGPVPAGTTPIGVPAGAPTTAAAAVIDVTSFPPGGVISISFVRGDLQLSGVGTVTHTVGDTVLALGHPMMDLGPIQLPVGGGTVHTVLANHLSSFKMASPGAPLGATVWDGATGLAAKVGATPSMLPMKMTVHDESLTAPRAFSVEIVKNSLLSPLMVGICIETFLMATAGHGDDVSIVLEARTRFGGGRELALSDRILALRGLPPDISMLAGMMGPLVSPYGPLTLEGVEVEARIERRRRTARLDRAWIEGGIARPGRTARLHVQVVPYGEKPTRIVMEVPVPADLPPGSFELAVSGGSGVAPALAPPETLDQLISNLADRPRADDLVVLLEAERATFGYRGAVLRDLPGSIQRMLGGATGADMPRLSNPLRWRKRTDWILEGSVKAQAILKEET